MALDGGIVGQERNTRRRQTIGASSNLSTRDDQAHFFRNDTRLQPHIRRCLTPPRRLKVGQQ